jgi:threonine aldolase
MQIVDIRSDTVTKPTPRMLEAMVKAEVGDDGYGEDPTVNKLEEMAAERLGKEAGLFLSSGTMANLVAVLVHTRPGDAVICDENAHLNRLTMGGTTAFAGVYIYTQKTDRLGRLNPQDIESTLDLDPRFPRASLVVMENTNNWGGGTTISPKETKKIAEIAKKGGLRFHIDGARVFNSALAQGVNVKELTKDCDSVMFCLSKSLCCPAGSILAGSREFIKEARRARKMLGGGMRQVGVLAACGIVALEEMIDRLKEDHKKARRLAEGLARIKPGMVDLETIQTNIVCFEFKNARLGCRELVKILAEKGVRTIHLQNDRGRMVTHKDVTMGDIDYALEVIESVISKHG